MTPNAATVAAPVAPKQHPLVVDLDGTLIRSDLLIETAFAKLAQEPLAIFAILGALLQGKAPLKHYLAETVDFDPSILPYDEAVVARIQTARDAGQAVYLVSASHQRLVKAVAEHLGLFTGWFASNESVNLSGETKTSRLVEEFGAGNFDYIGNDKADLAVWAKADKAISIRASGPVSRRLAKRRPDAEILPAPKPTWRSWLQLLRVHQYTKNALIFVPLFTSHQFTLTATASTVLAAAAFSLCASAVYLLNDLTDLQADRLHPRKRLRPLANGSIPLMHAIMAIPVLLVSAMAIAAAVSLPFLAVMLGYFCLTTAYSFSLKRKMLVDVVTLAMLYTIRVVAGTVAISAPFSEWLLAFSMFIFMSLALIKRYVELAVRLDSTMSDPANRNYKVSDLNIVGAIAAAAGFNAVTVFALYISSSTVHNLYRRPEFLWLICPILMYWISRTLMMAHRRLMEDDPIAFAIRDTRSLLAGALILMFLIAAT
jgi:4-hydroxybenzoate polyprenyltransferase/phosphoserine phosphatase